MAADVDPERVLDRLGPRAALSRETAAALWGLPLVGPVVPRVTVPRDRSWAEVPGWDVVRHDLGPGDVEEVDGLRRTSVVRTVLDLARVLPVEWAVATADAAVRGRGCTERELVERLSGCLGRGASRPRAVARLVDPRAESPLESLLRVLLVLAGLDPEPQVEVRDRHGRVVARLDLCFRGARLAVEADGFAFHSDRAAYRRDRQRLNELERLGWRVLRFTWEDVVGRPEEVVRLVRELLALAA